MNNNFDKNIQELLRSHTEPPSAKCWNKIETQLEAMQTPDVNTNSNSSSSSSGNSSSFSQFVGTVTGKIVSSVAAIVTIGGVISLIIVNSTETDTVEQSETVTIQEEIQTNLLSNEDNVRIIEEATDTLYTESRTENAVDKTLCMGEHIDTIVYHEQESVSLTHMPHISPVNPIHQTQTGNATNQEMASKIENKPEVITKEPEKEKISNNKDTHHAIEIEKENVQDKLEPPEFTIPNIFTPNGDYINDYFVIEDIAQFSETHLIVFRREDGKVVYEKTNYQNDWQAENVRDGVYFYIFKYIYQGSQFMRNGSITVKR
jgi:gliding motility-associated-like protein